MGDIQHAAHYFCSGQGYSYYSPVQALHWGGGVVKS